MANGREAGLERAGMDLQNLVRENILRMAGYTPGEQPRPDQPLVKLNTNENPYPPSPKIFEAIAAAGQHLRRYPDPLATSFREAASQMLGVPADWILATNGSDDALTILTRASCDPGDLMVSPTPSYPLYKVLADIQGCRFELRPFDEDGRLPVGFASGARLAVVPNPNSPTGTFIPPDQLVRSAGEGLFVVDEAYSYFAEDHAIRLVERHPRFVVTRSFSKSHSLAGLRFGYVIARPEVIEQLIKVKDSYNCDGLSIAAATAAILDAPYYSGLRARILDTRARVERRLLELGLHVTPSKANFLWFRSNRKSCSDLMAGLRARAILVRHLKYPGLAEGLRVSIGTDEEMDRFLIALEQSLAEG